MQHKPLKRHPALIELSRDHHQGLLLCWKIRTGFRKGVEVSRIINYVSYFVEELLFPHFKIEEQWVFTTLPADDHLRQEAEKQHKQLYHLSEEIGRKQENVSDILSDLEEKLEQHIRFEERQLFMHIQECLSENELQNLKENVETEHQEVQELWKDPFWE